MRSLDPEIHLIVRAGGLDAAVLCANDGTISTTGFVLDITSASSGTMAKGVTTALGRLVGALMNAPPASADAWRLA